MQKMQIGPTVMYVDGDVIFSIIGGEVDLPMVQEFMAVCEQVHAKYGRLFLLTDARHSFSVHSTARSYIAKWVRTHDIITGAATFGNSVIVRSMTLLLSRAMALIGNSKLAPSYFTDEKIARSYLRDLHARWIVAHPDAPKLEEPVTII